MGLKRRVLLVGVPCGYLLQADKLGNLWTLWIQRNASLISASVVEKLFYFCRQGAGMLVADTKSPCGHFFLYLQEIGAHKDELSFEQFHLFYKKLMFEQQKSVR